MHGQKCGTSQPLQRLQRSTSDRLRGKLGVKADSLGSAGPSKHLQQLQEVCKPWEAGNQQQQQQQFALMRPSLVPGSCACPCK